jgi:dihydrosphingosine 1-phosphate phosphatase
MGQGHVIYNPSTPGPGSIDSNEDDEAELLIGQESELGEKEMFSRLEKPRVRYDVEVVTKLVVYTGM